MFLLPHLNFIKLKEILNKKKLTYTEFKKKVQNNKNNF